MPLRVYIGWDQKDADAYRVCAHSLLKRSSIDVDIRPLVAWQLKLVKKFWRETLSDETGQLWDKRDGRPHSTDFTFTRFLVPLLEGYENGRAVFVDADFMFRADIAEMMQHCVGDKAIWCVKHKYEPPETEKMGGFIQARYLRKNWSSLMVFNPSRNQFLTPYQVNMQSGRDLHALSWLADEEIGDLPEEWNWLDGWSDPAIEPKAVHHTRGTPDLPGCGNVAYADEWRKELEECGSAFDV